MGGKFSFRKWLGATAAAVTLSLSPSFNSAAEPPPQPSKTAFVPHSPTGETCPAPDAQGPRVWKKPSFAAPARTQQKLLSDTGFSIGRAKADGVFTERTVQSVNEFRILTGHADFRESFTSQDMRTLKNFSTQTRNMAKLYKLSADEAATLLFAARHTKQGAAKLNVALFARDLPAMDDAVWISLVARHGKEYGLDVFAKHVSRDKSGAVSVSDPVWRAQILALREHPRLSRLLAAEYIAETGKKPSAYTPALPPFNELAEQQKNLKLLGFDLQGEDEAGKQGPMTETAAQMFSLLYGPVFSTFGPALTAPGHAQGIYLRLFAELAQKDAADHGISTAAAAAIRLANLRTGADFGYMMELSSAESNFDPDAKARTSSATGLYQFTEDTWLHMIRRYGEKYGLGDLTRQVEAKEDMYGTLVARVENPYARMMMLELRKDPHLAALMSAEFQMRNKWLIECTVGRELNRTEQYLGHFLGRRGAAHFIDRMEDNPQADGTKMFPTAAAANKPVFYKKNGKGKPAPRTLKEIYNALDRKFNQGTFEDKGIPEDLSTEKLVSAETPAPPLSPPPAQAP